MPEPIRILQVFAQMNRGGAETMIMNLYRNIDRSIVQFDFVVHTDVKCSYDDEIRALGGYIYRIETYNGKNHYDYKKSWSIFFQNNPQYKIIHGHVRSTASIYLGIAKKYGLSTIAHSHNTSSGNGLSAIAKNILQYPIRYTADYLFACSKSAGDWLFGKKACQKENFYLIKNAIDSEQFTFDEKIRLSKRREFNINDKYVIGHVGRFHTQKNHDFLIDIFKEVHNKKKNAVLLLIGDGNLQAVIENKIRDNGLIDSVIFTGVRTDISELMQAMDVFVFPSLFEGLGIVTIEAQTTGLPTIVSETIPNEAYLTDLIIKEKLSSSPTKWAEKILEYTEGYERKNRTETIKSMGYDISETAYWLQKFYLKIYNERYK